jgi:AraC-like DNA-binding protein
VGEERNRGPIALSLQLSKFFVGVNDPMGLNPTGLPFDPNIFDLYKRWLGLWFDSDEARYRLSVARDEEVFNTTKTDEITSILRLVPLAVLASCVQRVCRLRIMRRVRRNRSCGGRARKLEIEMPPTPSRLLRISTEMLPERERFAAFREEFARRVLWMDVIDHSDGRPRIDVTFMPLGEAAVGTFAATPVEFIRQKHHLNDRSDGFILQIVETGPVQFSHAGGERTYDAGSGCFIDQGRPMRGLGPSHSRIRNVAVRATALKTLVHHPEDLAGHVVRPGAALRLLDGYLRSLASLDQAPSPELAPIIGVHLLDLVAAALGPTAEAAEFVAQRGVKAARLRTILAEIARRFNEPDFDLDSVAGTLGLSRRYVQQLLEETGKSFTEHLVERRLERAFAMLSDRRYLHLAIIDIAFAVGFGDVSHFNRVFRRSFGETPSGARAGRIAREQK